VARGVAKAKSIEQCWILVGQHVGRVWHCKRLQQTRGTLVSVEFDGAWVLEREETHGDVLGFLHTHPQGPARPSERDHRTMRAWCSAFGKPLLCLIESPGGVGGFRFDPASPDIRPLTCVACFRRGIIVGVDRK
jgi:proteasome lid subunit RPN8/RPN11